MYRLEKDGTGSNWHDSKQAYYRILSRRKVYGRCMICTLFIMKSLLVQYWLVHLPNSRRSGFKSLTGIVMGVIEGVQDDIIHYLYAYCIWNQWDVEYQLHISSWILKDKWTPLYKNPDKNGSICIIKNTFNGFQINPCFSK